MSVTIAGEIRGLVVDWGEVNQRAWQDSAPASPTLPYVTIQDAVDVSPALAGDGRVNALSRTLQASLWQAGQDYDPQLVTSLIDALDGAVIAPTSGKARRVRVAGWNRVREPDTNIVQCALTLTVSHDRSTS